MTSFSTASIIVLCWLSATILVLIVSGVTALLDNRQKP